MNDEEKVTAFAFAFAFVVLVVLVVLVACGLFLLPVLNYWGTWLMSRPQLCREQVSNTGASGHLALTCDTRVTTCRCP